MLSKFCHDSCGIITLLQRCVEWASDDKRIMEAIINSCPKLICAVNTASDPPSAVSGSTAIDRNDTQLLLVVLNTIFSLGNHDMAVTNACDLIFKHQADTIKKYPDVWMKALKSMVLRCNESAGVSRGLCLGTSRFGSELRARSAGDGSS